MGKRPTIRMNKNCPICGKTLNAENTVIDRIVPVRLGGADDSWNLRYICRECNARKADNFNPLLEYYLLQMQDQSKDDPQLGLKIDHILRNMTEEDRKALLEQIKSEQCTYQYISEPKNQPDINVDYMYVAEGHPVLFEKTRDRADAIERSLAALKHYNDLLSEVREQINDCIFVFDKEFPVDQYRELLEAYAGGRAGEVFSVYLDEDGKVVIY